MHSLSFLGIFLKYGAYQICGMKLYSYIALHNILGHMVDIWSIKNKAFSVMHYEIQN